ncbi:MAG: polyprenyl diphosphate synthase [Candidatus Hydrogenedentes bacterium]|jgi:undecaprenyl diphosphate synthase|nr:polyprenyl diphosphate synthase [Candidatus Hydrogenedentota bacterium]
MSKSELDMQRLPRHVAIIMDGNGRWAKKRGLSHIRGHEAGATSVRVIVEACRELDAIESLSLYAFSTENWRRSKNEVNALFRLLNKHINLEIDNLHKEGIRVVFTGRKKGLSKKVMSDMEASMEKTRANKAMILNIAVNYGARAELVDACRAIAEDARNGGIRPKDIDEDTIARRLYLPELHDVDLLIRTSGELRLSNFMLWQISYAEIVATRIFWPDFRKRHLHQAFLEYQSRDRRFGGRK